MSPSAAFTLEQGIAHLASIVGQQHVALRDQTSQTIVAAPADAQRDCRGAAIRKCESADRDAQRRRHQAEPGAIPLRRTSN